MPSPDTGSTASNGSSEDQQPRRVDQRAGQRRSSSSCRRSTRPPACRVVLGKPERREQLPGAARRCRHAAPCGAARRSAAAPRRSAGRTAAARRAARPSAPWPRPGPTTRRGRARGGAGIGAEQSGGHRQGGRLAGTVRARRGRTCSPAVPPARGCRRPAWRRRSCVARPGTGQLACIQSSTAPDRLSAVRRGSGAPSSAPAVRRGHSRRHSPWLSGRPIGSVDGEVAPYIKQWLVGGSGSTQVAERYQSQTHVSAFLAQTNSTECSPASSRTDPVRRPFGCSARSRPT